MTEASDIEIYIARVNASTVVSWLEGALDKLDPLPRQNGMLKNAHCYKGSFNDKSFTVMIIDKVIGQYTSVWIDSTDLPWTDDRSCGLAAAMHFQKEVRIAAGLWQEKDDPDAWISMTADGEEVAVRWQTQT